MIAGEMGENPESPQQNTHKKFKFSIVLERNYNVQCGTFEENGIAGGFEKACHQNKCGV